MAAHALASEYRDTVTCSICQEDIDTDRFKEERRYVELIPLLAVYNGGVSRNHVFHRSCILPIIVEDAINTGRFPSCPCCGTPIRSLCTVNFQCMETIVPDAEDTIRFTSIRSAIPQFEKDILRQQDCVSRANRVAEWLAKKTEMNPANEGDEENPATGIFGMKQANEPVAKMEQDAMRQEEPEAAVDHDYGSGEVESGVESGLDSGVEPQPLISGAEFEQRMTRFRQHLKEDTEINLKRQAEDILRSHRRRVEDEYNADMRRREDQTRRRQREMDDQRLREERRLSDDYEFQQRRMEDWKLFRERQAHQHELNKTRQAADLQQ